MRKMGLLTRRARYYRFRHVAAQIAPGERVLDCGCGLGDLPNFLPADCKYVGVDQDLSEISAAGASAKEQMFCEADMASPAFENLLTELGMFDAVVLAAVIEHLDNPSNLLQTLARHIADRGRLILTTPHPRSEGLYRVAVNLGLLTRAGGLDDHKRLWGQAELQELLETSAWQVVRYCRFVMGLNQLCVAERRVDWGSQEDTEL